MKPMRWLLVILMILVPGVAAMETNADDLHVQNLGGDLWLVVDDLPEGVQPELLARLYEYLKMNVQVNVESPLLDDLGMNPVVVRFVGDDAASFFPHSSEGFAGMTGLAAWMCAPKEEAEIVTCQIFEADEDTPNEDLILLAAVSNSQPFDGMLGVVAHEIAHTLGAVDGPRCPANENYDPAARYEADTSDTYWWYGVVGVFSYRPQGIVWDALNGQCESCDAPEICLELEAILAVPEAD